MLLKPALHCFRFLAQAEPLPLRPHYDADVHGLAVTLYRGFLSDCDAQVAQDIQCILRYLAATDYSIDAVMLLKEEAMESLLHAIFCDDDLDYEDAAEVQKRLAWLGDLHRSSLRSRPSQPAAGVVWKLQVTACYQLDQSAEAHSAILDAYNNHEISSASAVVSAYEVVPSHSYRVVLSFSCDFVPLHFLDLPEIVVGGLSVPPIDLMVVTEAILDHDGQQESADNPTEVCLVSPEGREVPVSSCGFLFNRYLWGRETQCVATAKKTQRQCLNRTHHVSRRCHLHRDVALYPAWVSGVTSEPLPDVSGLKMG